MEIDRAWELLETAGADPLEVARACEQIKAFVEARQLVAIQELTEQEPGFIDTAGQLCEPAAVELACAMTWSPYTATARVELAEELHSVLPDALAALRDGVLDMAKTQEIVRGTRDVTPSTRVMLAERAYEYAGTHTRAQLKAWLARQVARLDPEGAEKRRRTAKKQRRVWVQPEGDGMATIGAFLTAEEAQACYESLRLAAANHEGAVDAVRADLFVERLSGISPAEPVPVQVLMTPMGPEIAGHGPISDAHADKLCPEERPRITVQAPPPSFTYRPSAALTRYIRARDRHCRFPGCRRPAVHCDVDHVIPWPAGMTSASNTHCLCRYHHRIKTHGNWRVRIDPDATVRWTSPRGHEYVTRADDP